ncbi:MAG: DUF4255 domain-containing protein [Nitrospirota bacterium]|nr:DUF4255 domain-containing protein [Nitrospirota bacterium]
MIGEVLVFLKNHLNAKLSVGSGFSVDEVQEDQVVFVDGEKMDPIVFKLGAVSVLLLNVEEENTLRPADPYRAVADDGTIFKVQPEIRMNLYVLFVARYKQYEQGLSTLSNIIQYLQKNRVLNHHNAPELSETIEKLIMELTTLPFAQQNEIWNALRTTYHPSVLYKVKMVTIQDDSPIQSIISQEKTLRKSSL